MIKTMFVGLWVCIVTLAASYGAMTYLKAPAPDSEAEEFFGGLESRKPEGIAVPIVRDGMIKGYVIAQFSFTIKAELLKRLSVEPDIFLLDAAFRTIYEEVGGGSGKRDKSELDRLAKTILSRVNKRFGKSFVQDVLVQQYKFVAKSRERGGKMKFRPPVR